MGAHGSPGNPGPQGSPGKDGSAGQPGPRGQRGFPGERGAVGPRGFPGVKGDDGRQGTPGLPGSSGAPGKNGVDGRPGFPGAAGSDGARGAPGKDGETPRLDEFYGVLKGVVRKASDASYVGGATVDILADKQVIRSMVTPASGKFQFRIAGGEYVVRIRNVAGMVGLDYTEPVEILNSRTTQRTYAVARPVGPGKLRMVLTWGENPRDLDSHLLTSTGCQVSFRRKQCPDGSASLDTDVTDGFGPETINVHSLRPGLYKYRVHAYSSGAMEDSEAEVTLYGVEKQAVQFHVSRDGKVENGWWSVVNIRVDDNGKVTLEDVD